MNKFPICQPLEVNSTGLDVMHNMITEYDYCANPLCSDHDINSTV